MTISKETIFQKKKKLPWRRIEEVVVIVDLESEKVHQCNEVACLIWDQINGLHSVNDIINSIVDEFDVDGKQAYADAVVFLQKLLTKNLISTI